MASVQLDAYNQEMDEALKRFWWSAKVILLVPVVISAYFVLRSIVRIGLRKVYRDFQVLIKAFDQVLSSTINPSEYAATLVKRTEFANRLEELTNKIERLRPVQIRDDFWSPSTISEFRSFIAKVRRQEKSDSAMASAIAFYASVPDVVPISPEQRRWDPEKGQRQLQDLNDILPYIASADNFEPKSSD